MELNPVTGAIAGEWLNPAIEEGHRELLYRIERLSAEDVEPLLDQP